MLPLLLDPKPDLNESQSMDASSKLHILSTLSKKLSQGVDIEEFLKESADNIALAMNAARVTIYFIDKKREELWSKVAHLAEIDEIRLKVGQGVAGNVANTGETANINTSYSDARFYAAIDEKTGFTTHSQLCTPMCDSHGEILGVIQVLNKKTGSFTEEDCEFLEILASQLAILIQNTSLYLQIQNSRNQDTRTFPLKCRYNNVIGSSSSMQHIYKNISKIAPTSATILILGASGTGKEMIARTIHLNSLCKNKPFIKIDCTTLPETLLENELFGHEKGAFTGATQRTLGKLAAAKDGTLFIDEIGELPLTMQKRLLRVLQDREYEPLGSTRSCKVEARILAATNRNLEDMVAKELFRQDLYFRIKVVQLNLPPLKKRGEKDIIALAQHFLAKYNRRYHRCCSDFTAKALNLLTTHSWPGNVRELEHCVESAVILSESNIITHNDISLPVHILEQVLPEESELLSLEEVEKKHILKVLEITKGNKSQACKILQIGRNTLKRKLKSYGHEE